jgi:hypothetical protein
MISFDTFPLLFLFSMYTVFIRIDFDALGMGVEALDGFERGRLGMGQMVDGGLVDRFDCFWSVLRLP